jgi:hypothetical protein
VGCGLIVTAAELKVVVDALHSTGDAALAERFEAVLHQFGLRSSRERRPEPDAGDGRPQHEQSPHPNPPSVDGRCDRCGWRGKVYPGRYGGFRCAVCFGLQWGWMPRE